MISPNYITGVRLFLALPLIIGFLLEHPFSNYLSWLAFVLSGLSDYLDGWFARKYNLSSQIGEVFDHISDKIIVSLTILLLMFSLKDNVIFTISAIVVIIREILISGLRNMLSVKGIKLLVSKGGKVKAGLQFISLGIILLSRNNSFLQADKWLFFIGIWSFVAVATFTLFSAVEYVVQVVDKLKKIN